MYYNTMSAGEGYGASFAEEALQKERKFRKAKQQSDQGDLFDRTEIVHSDASDSGNAMAAKSAISTAAQGGSAADIASSGMIASGNPYAMAGGYGLAVLSAGQKKRQAEEDAKAQAQNQRIQNQQSALARMMQMAEGLRRL